MRVGEIDLEMLSELRLKYPEVTVDNEVVEPSGTQLQNYKGTIFMCAVSVHTCSQNFSEHQRKDMLHLYYIFFTLFFRAENFI